MVVVSSAFAWSVRRTGIATGCRLGRRRGRRGHTWRAMPMVVVCHALPVVTVAVPIIRWLRRRGGRLGYSRWAVPVISVGRTLALIASGCCGGGCRLGRRCCGFRHTGRAMPVVVVRSALLVIAVVRWLRRRGGRLGYSRRAVPVISMGRTLTLIASGCRGGGCCRLGGRCCRFGYTGRTMPVVVMRSASGRRGRLARSVCDTGRGGSSLSVDLEAF